MNTRLTTDTVKTISEKIRTGLKEVDDKYPLVRKYAMSAEQNEAWACMMYMEGHSDDGVTVPLSDIWRGEIPGAGDMTVSLDRTDDGLYLALTDACGTVRDTDVDEIMYSLPRGYSDTYQSGFPLDYWIQNQLLHTALVRLMTEAGLFEDETKHNEYR